MGAWGTAIFSDDLAADVRNDYTALLSIGKSGVEAEQLLLDYYAEILNCQYEEEAVFWFALALAEWNKGRLSEFVKSKAIAWIEQGGDLERWNTTDNQKNFLKRKKVIEELYETLMSPVPTEKKVRKPTVHHCPWRVGSLLAYRIVTNFKLKNDPLFGKYALLRVIQVDKHPVSKIVPTAMYDETMLVGLYGWVGDEIPNPNIVDKLEYIPVAEYVPPTPRAFDLSALDNLGEESRSRLLKQLTSLTERRVETCAQLDWLPYKDRQGDITFLDCDPSFEQHVPSFFKTGSTQYAITHFLPFDKTLATQLRSYYNQP